MGLINKEGTIIKEVEIKPAYAKIFNLSFDMRGGNKIAYATFGISTERNHLEKDLILDGRVVSFIVDTKEDQLLKQAYEAAKENDFKGWEDDIVVIPDEGVSEEE